MSASAPDRAAVSVSAVHLREGGRQVLLGVDLALAPGTRTALLGPARAGKTALLQVIQGMERPHTGSVEVAGRSARRVVEVRRGLGYVPADPSWYPHLTCHGLGDFLQGLYPTWDRARFVDLLARLGVPPRHRAAGLTLAVRARLALAAALAHSPPLLLVDLSARLDPVARERLLTALDEELPSGTTLLVASDRLDGLADRTHDLVVLVAGEVRFAGAQADLLARLRRLEVAASDAPEVPSGARQVAWRRRSAQAGEWIVDLQTPQQLAQVLALPAVTDCRLLDLEQAYLALACAPPGLLRARPAPALALGVPASAPQATGEATA
jgi:ABC-2 type transport system ATP-binding protein